MITPFNDCDSVGKPSKYLVNHKWWILSFMLINMFHISKAYLIKKINGWYAQDRITYRRRKMLKYIITFGLEGINIAWQIYGNFIYFEWRGATDTDNKAFEKCMDEKNNGFEFAMFMLLVLGYLTLVLYAGILIFVCIMLLRNRRS